MSEEISPIDRYVLDKEADKVGGVVTFLFGEQGAGKTLAMVNKAKIDFEEDRIVIWRGQESCQWILLAAQNLPITLWMDKNINSYDFYTTGDLRTDIETRKINITEAKDIDVKIKEFKEPSEIIEHPETDRVNVYYIPGDKSDHIKDRYYAISKTTDLWKAMNRRTWGNHICYLDDEAPDILSPETQQPLYPLINFVMPKEMGNFRKNNISNMNNAHHKSEIFYKFHDIKSNSDIYFRGSKISSRNNEIDQNAVNKLDRGQFIVPGWERGKFKMPYMPHETISWMRDEPEFKLKLNIEASIPDIRPEKDVEQKLKDSPIDERILEDIVDVSEAADILDTTNRTVRRRISKGKIPAILAQNKYLMSRSNIENSLKQD
ncbi:MAG: helix-turn-helix domain-containing protein [Bacteroidales bacterium]